MCPPSRSSSGVPSSPTIASSSRSVNGTPRRTVDKEITRVEDEIRGIDRELTEANLPAARRAGRVDATAVVLAADDRDVAKAIPLLVEVERLAQRFSLYFESGE